LKPARDARGVVVWAHPDGMHSLAAAQKLVDAGFAVLAIDLMAFPPPKAEPSNAKNPNPPYSSYFNGYNRTPIANHVHDLLTAIAVARKSQPHRPVHLLGVGRAGPAALLARALAGDAVERAAIDLNQFDFNQIKTDADPMLLPGALKYGGIRGFLPLIDSGQTLIVNLDVATKSPHITVSKDRLDVPQLIEWLIEQN
jgi:hypothetical protein